MIVDALPDIPRWYTGLAEWAAVVTYVLIMRPRFTGPVRYVTLALALPALVGLQFFLGTLPIEFWVVGMLAAVGLMFGTIHLCSDTTVKDGGYLAARAFVLAELVASLQWQLEVYYSQKFFDEDLGFALRVVLLVVVYAAGHGAAYLAERRNFPQRMRLGIDGRSLVITLGIAIGTFLVSNLSFITTNTPFSGQRGGEIFYIRTLVDLAGFVALYTQQSNRNFVRDAMELAKTRMIMKSQHQQYLQSKRNIEELNRMHHDLKYYAAAIREESSVDRRSEYLQALEDSIRGYESEIQTGNPVLDVLLSSKMERCLQENISMTLIVDGAALNFMDSISLSAYFGNALDNAIEAEMKLANPEERIIKVSVFTQSEFVMIRIENWFPLPVEFSGGLPETTKADRSRHGYGTLNMRSIAEQYKGTLTLSVEDEWFIARALIPIPAR